METDCSEPELDEETATDEADESFAAANSFDAQKRKNSFVWQYFRAVKDSVKTYECVICKGCVDHRTSNLARHLFSAHNIKKQDEDNGSTTRGRPSRSFIWKYCTKENSKHARCHLCQNLLYFGGGNTGNISKHLRRKHLDLLDDKEVAIQKRENMEELNETMHAVVSIDSGLEDAAASSVNGGGKAIAFIKQEHIDLKVAQQQKERKGSSYVWKYCDKLSRHTIRCRLCKKLMSFHGTANVITHLQRRHNIVGKVEGDQDKNTSVSCNAGEDIAEAGENTFGRRRRSAAATSIVWKYCTRIGKGIVRCGFCKKNLSYQGTSNLQRHLHRMHGIITRGRAVESDEKEANESFDSAFIWEYCTQTEDGHLKCNMCDEVIDDQDVDRMGRHLRLTHAINPLGKDSSDRQLRTPKKNIRSLDAPDMSDDDEDEDAYRNDDEDSWSKVDDGDYNAVRSGLSRKNDSLFDDIIEEDQNAAEYDEDPFDPSMVQNYPIANPLSPQSSRGASPDRVQKVYFKSKRLRQLNEERVRMETEYFREKAGFYRMQKYLTALQAKKIRVELARMHNPELNGEYVANTATTGNTLPPTQ